MPSLLFHFYHRCIYSHIHTRTHTLMRAHKQIHTQGMHMTAHKFTGTAAEQGQEGGRRSKQRQRHGHSRAFRLRVESRGTLAAVLSSACGAAASPPPLIRLRNGGFPCCPVPPVAIFRNDYMWSHLPNRSNFWQLYRF